MTQKIVLIVDDDFHIVNVLTLKLKNAHYEVISASNGEEALQRIEERSPDLVITDFSMPVMNGVDLVRRIRESENTKDIPVIMLTARGQTVEEGDDGVPRIEALLSKPFSPREVLSQVQCILK